MDPIVMGCTRGALALPGRRFVLVVLASSLAAACDKRALDDRDAGGVVTGLAGAGAGAGGASAGAGGVAGAPSGGAGIAGNRCATGAAGAGAAGGILGTQCTDGIDNDGDGRIDYDDPECLGGYDNDESSFAWGIPGDNIDFCKTDCFFDGNSGSGDDNCLWQLKCDPLSRMVSCPYDATYASAHPMECSLTASQPQVCVDRCSKLVPNGCDCFGCCTVPGLAGTVRLDWSCTAGDFADPVKCPPCTQVTQCLNPCERCEVCIGKATLPLDCVALDGHAPDSCPAGVIVCGAYGIAPSCCPAGTSCVTGCCLPLDPVF